MAFNKISICAPKRLKEQMKIVVEIVLKCFFGEIELLVVSKSLLVRIYLFYQIVKDSFVVFVALLTVLYVIESNYQ